MKEIDVNDQVLAARLKQIGEHRDFLHKLKDFCETLPETQQAELALKIGRIADVLAWELDQLRAWNIERQVKH